MTDMMESAGIDPTFAFKKAAIDRKSVDDPGAQLSGNQEFEFQRAFADCTRDVPGLWLQTGQNYRLMSYGPLGLAILAARNVREACRILDDFQLLTFSLMYYEVHWDHEQPTALVAHDEKVPKELREFHQERALGSATVFLNDMVQGKFPLARIDSVLDRPDNWLDIETLVGAPVRFNARQTQWVFQNGVGDKPLPMGNPLLEETYARQCADLVRKAKVEDNLVDRLYNLLVRESQGFPNAATAARRLNVSERTLFRKLRNHDLSYGLVLDQIREKRAQELLVQSRLSMETIAEILGFAETASFSRAFKRWTGVPPTHFRNQSSSSR